MPPYVPIDGDPIDELMAKHLNESKYHINVKALGDGHYMFGNKKLTARIMNEKLVIKHGSGFMLIDEFIKNYGDSTQTTTSSTVYSSRIQNPSSRMSPKRTTTGGSINTGLASPKRTGTGAAMASPGRTRKQV